MERHLLLWAKCNPVALDPTSLWMLILHCHESKPMVYTVNSTNCFCPFNQIHSLYWLNFMRYRVNDNNNNRELYICKMFHAFTVSWLGVIVGSEQLFCRPFYFCLSMVPDQSAHSPLTPEINKILLSHNNNEYLKWLWCCENPCTSAVWNSHTSPSATNNQRHFNPLPPCSDAHFTKSVSPRLHA